MRKSNLYIIAICIYGIFISMMQGYALSQYRWFRNSSYGFELIVPSNWKIDEVATNSKYIFTAFAKDAEITLRVFDVRDGVDIDLLMRNKTKSNNMLPIVNNETLVKKGRELGKISVFQYKIRKNAYLTRTLIAQSNEYIYILECTSTMVQFPKYEDIFTVAMSSFKSQGTGSRIALKADLSDDTFEADEKALNKQWFRKDFIGEASEMGFEVPAVKNTNAKISIAFESDGKSLMIEPTSSGVVMATMFVPKSFSGDGYSMVLWKNGEESLIAGDVKGGATVQSKVVLVRGDNFICTILKKDDDYIARSPVARIKSSIADSLARFEMTWNGRGDVDLHLASIDGSWHVSFANPSVFYGGTNAYLDVDNIFGFGPENIRVLSLPRKTKVRCFVNYYSGFLPLQVTVRQYDKYNKLVKKYSKDFMPMHIMPTSEFNYKSWLVGEFEVSP